MAYGRRARLRVLDFRPQCGVAGLDPIREIRQGAKMHAFCMLFGMIFMSQLSQKHDFFGYLGANPQHKKIG